LESRVLGKQDSQKKYDGGKKLRVFEMGDPVFTYSALNGSRKITSIPAVVQRATGPLSYELEIKGQGIIRRHVDHIRRRYSEVLPSVLDGPDFPYDIPVNTPPRVHDSSTAEPIVIQDDQASVGTSIIPPDTSTSPRTTAAKETAPVETSEPVPQRSERETRKPKRLTGTCLVETEDT